MGDWGGVERCVAKRDGRRNREIRTEERREGEGEEEGKDFVSLFCRCQPTAHAHYVFVFFISILFNCSTGIGFPYFLLFSVCVGYEMLLGALGHFTHRSFRKTVKTDYKIGRSGSRIAKFHRPDRPLTLVFISGGFGGRACFVFCLF